MSKYLTNVRADRDNIGVTLERPDSGTSTTVLASWTFNRETANLHLVWTVDGRRALSVSERLDFAFRAFRLTRKILA